MKQISTNDLIGDVISKVSSQSYAKKPSIDDVKIIELKRFSGEDGMFEEVMRIDDDGMSQSFPKFILKQINRSILLPGAIKAWHLHFNQEDIWYVSPEDQMLLGLWDLRQNSKTRNVKMKIVLGGGLSRLVYIPRGVAHGVVNLAPERGTIIYFVNQQFNLDNSDEHRLPWNILGEQFWIPEKG